MASGDEEENKGEIEDCSLKDSSTNGNGNHQVAFSPEELQNEIKVKKKWKNRLLGMIGITSVPLKSSYMKFRSSTLSSPSIKLRQFAEGREEISRSIAATPHNQSQASSAPHMPTATKIDWSSLWKMSKAWIRDPLNMALFAWITCVSISGAILFMVMTGMLNNVLPKKSQRDVWFEVNNQILNALFTLMCLFQHPRRFHYLALLLRWKEKDILRLRKMYCKNGTYKPNEWIHMMVVITLLHINCFAQYALCSLNLGYRRSSRPAIGVAVCISVAIAAPVIATVYNILSPLGREYELEIDQESQLNNEKSPASFVSLEKKFSFAIRENNRVPESLPQWAGGLLDFWDDLSLAYLSIFCSFCVFGWNMDRLGFGNMYVHIATFVFLCVAPFLIFNLAAINIDDETVREALGMAGIVLCIFGLLYGGFWRIQMRKKFKLPENNLCCRSPSMTDCIQWLCCCSCSLAQEVKTANFYEIVEDKFFMRPTTGEGTPVMDREGGSPPHPEEGSPFIRSGPSSPLWNSSSPPIFRSVHAESPSRLSPPIFRSVHAESPSRFVNKVHVDDVKLTAVGEEGTSKGDCKDGTTLTPPCPSQIQRDENQEP